MKLFRKYVSVLQKYFKTDIKKLLRKSFESFFSVCVHGQKREQQ